MAAAICAALLAVDEVFGPVDTQEWTNIGWFAVTLYFAIRSCRFLLCRYRAASQSARMWGTLAVLAFIHVLGLASFFTLPFAYDRPRNLYAEAWGVEFWVIAAVFAALWLLISMLILLHHVQLHQSREILTLRLLAIGVFGVLLALAIGATQLPAPALTLFKAFGADLPTPTLLFMQDRWALYLLPAGALAATFVIWLSRDSSAGAARFASGSLVGLLTLGNASLYFGLLSLFLPFFGCSFEGLDSGYTRLHAAALLGRQDAVLDHLANGMDVNVEDAQGFRPLDQVPDNSAEMARLLIARGGMRSTKESRRNRVEGLKAKASAAATFSSCGV